jgi:hypothetical protein
MRFFTLSLAFLLSLNLSAASRVPVASRCELAIAMLVPFHITLPPATTPEEAAQAKASGAAVEKALEDLVEVMLGPKRPLEAKSIISMMKGLGAHQPDRVSFRELEELLTMIKVSRDPEHMSAAKVFSSSDSKLEAKYKSEGRLRWLRAQYAEMEDNLENGEAAQGNPRVEIYAYRYTLPANKPFKLLEKPIASKHFYTVKIPLGVASLYGFFALPATTLLQFLGSITAPEANPFTLPSVLYGAGMLTTGMLSVSLLNPMSPLRSDKDLGSFFDYIDKSQKRKAETELYTTYGHYGMTMKVPLANGKQLTAMDLVYRSLPNEEPELFTFIHRLGNRPNFPTRGPRRRERTEEKQEAWEPGLAPVPGT